MGIGRRSDGMHRCWFAGLAAAAAVVTTGCGKAEPEPVPLRAVKTVVFGGQQGSATRSYAAQARAVVRSSLASQVGGRVLQTPFGIGDRVRKGSILARLDQRPLRLRVQQAQAEVRRADAALLEAVQRAHAQRTLMVSGFGTRQELDQAIATETAARSAVESAGSTLALAQRDVDLAVIRAPHDGVVAARTVEPFAEVQPGQVVVELDGVSGVELVSFVPVAVARRLRVAQWLSVRVPNSSQAMPVQVIAIGQRTTQADTVPVIVQPSVHETALLPGSFGELRVTINASRTSEVVPVEAVLPATPSTGAAIFVVEQNSQVALRPVKLGAVTQQGIEVTSGLYPGELIVATGVGFLRDRQAVRLLPPTVR